MDVALGMVLGMVIAVSLAAGWRLAFTRGRVQAPEAAAMQAAVHAATSLLPPLRRGLDRETARPAVRALLLLTGAQAVALADGDALLAFDGAGADHHQVGDPPRSLAGRRPATYTWCGGRCPHPGCPCVGDLRALIVQSGRTGTSSRSTTARAGAPRGVAHGGPRRPRWWLRSCELSEVEAQGERLARAELRSLRAQISPHFIYNALAAVAAFIHSRPEEARELLDGVRRVHPLRVRRQEPVRHAGRRARYVEKYLRLEQARFGDRMRVRVQVDPDILPAVVPVLSVQPLVENAVRHGVESRPEGATIEIEGRSVGSDVRLCIRDDGAGMDRATAAAALAGNGRGIGLYNVQSRLQATFGEGYGIQLGDGPGTEVVMTLPKFRAGVRPA